MIANITAKTIKAGIAKNSSSAKKTPKIRPKADPNINAKNASTRVEHVHRNAFESMPDCGLIEQD